MTIDVNLALTIAAGVLLAHFAKWLVLTALGAQRGVKATSADFEEGVGRSSGKTATNFPVSQS